MGMMKAAKLCPQAIVLPVDFEEVRKYSRLLQEHHRRDRPGDGGSRRRRGLHRFHRRARAASAKAAARWRG